MTLLWISISASAYDFEVDGICYNVIDPSALTCGVCGLDENNSNNENPIIPSHVSFSGKNLTVIEIQERAFEETDIVSISLPSTCMSIGRSAFWRCSKLSAIDIPQGVTNIGSHAFSFCNSLTEISIPKSLTKIGEYAFSDCENIQNVNISDLKSWCTISFESGGCYNLSDTYTSNPLSNMKAQLLLDGELISDLSFDDSINEISSGAFVGYSHIIGINLSDNIKSIGRYSFWNCQNLEKVRIGCGISEIPDFAFAQCPNLNNLYISDDEHELKFNGGTWGDRYNSIAVGYKAGDFRDSRLKEVYIGRNLVQPATTNAIKGYYAIFDQQEIDSVIIGPNVNLVTKSYFNGSLVSGSGLVGAVKNIRKLNILPSKNPLSCMFEAVDYGVVSEGPFQTINLDSLILERNLEAQYKYDYVNFHRVNTFFDQCTNLSYFEIGNGITDIGYLNLDKNEDIQSILVKSSVPPICSAQEFSKNVYIKCTVKVPLGYEDSYIMAPVWKNFWNIEGADFTSSIELIPDKVLKYPVGIYDIKGVRLKEPINGLNIIKYSDGTTEKKYY